MAEQDQPAAALSEDQRARLEEFIEEEEGHLNRYKGWLARFLTVVAVASSVFHLYTAYGIVRADFLRIAIIVLAGLVQLARRARAPVAA